MKRKLLAVLLVAMLGVSLAVPAFAAGPEIIPSITVNFEVDGLPDLNITLTNFYENFIMDGDSVRLGAAKTSSTVRFNTDVEIVYYNSDNEEQWKSVKSAENIILSDYCAEVASDGRDFAFFTMFYNGNDYKDLLFTVYIDVMGESYASQYYSGGFTESPGALRYQLDQLKDYAVDSGPVAPTPVLPTPQTQTVNPTASTVYLNGVETAFEAYNIGGSNYFKLRDLAYVLNGTEKQFEVGYDNDTRAITLTSGKAYTPTGNQEMIQGDGKSKTATPSASKIYLDGEELSLTVYNIGGNNFFKLRDLMEAVDVYVGYDSATKAITLDTSEGYVAE